jgi:hypothetical protein
VKIFRLCFYISNNLVSNAGEIYKTKFRKLDNMVGEKPQNCHWKLEFVKNDDFFLKSLAD